MVNPFIVLYSPTAAPGRSQIASLAELLQLRGLQVHVCLDAEAMLAQCQPSSPAPAVVFLSGSQAENCAYALQLRMLYAQVGLLATLDPCADESLALELLHSGIDSYCNPQASHTLTAALIYRLWRRVAGEAVLLPPAGPTPSSTASTEGWVFSEQGWAVVSPCGKRLMLTTGERAFMCALLAAPGRSASHRDLINAINQSYALDDGPLSLSRLGVMVSRLRRKFARNGLVMPVKSMHSRGYMFTGLLGAEAPGLLAS